MESLSDATYLECCHVHNVSFRKVSQLDIPVGEVMEPGQFSPVELLGIELLVACHDLKSVK